MKSTSLFRKSLGFFLLASIPLAVCVSVAGMILMGQLHESTFRESLLASAKSFAVMIGSQGSETGSHTVESTQIPGSTGISPLSAGNFARRVSAASGYRVTFILPDGSVLAESSAQPGSMSNHASRPEVASALLGKAAVAKRVSSTLDQVFLYAAVPIRDEKGVSAVLRLATALPDLKHQLAPFRMTLIVATLIASIAALYASWIFSRQISLPLEDLTVLAAQRLSISEDGESRGISLLSDSPSFNDSPATADIQKTGSLPTRLSMPREVSLLYESIDAMSAKLHAQVESARDQANRFSAILESMGEAVFALDSDLKIITANPAARKIARDPDMTREGSSFLDAIRSPELESISSECISTGKQKFRDIPLFGPGETWFRVHASPFPLTGSAGAQSRGVVLALTDITELRRLERVRTEFVANVSHELRTPIQLIKGFSETLLSPQAHETGQMRRFLEIIAKNADRMGNILSDLLSLARLEQDSDSWLATERIEASAVISEALDTEAPVLKARGTRIETDCPRGLFLDANLGLMEQALANLIDNAAKYSPESSLVRIKAGQHDGIVLFSVADEGPGIPLKDIPHLFERFYRVDKARSRQSGGTGLGLAIVRHIAIVHKGSAAVRSQSGKGSIFEIAIPAVGNIRRKANPDGVPLFADPHDNSSSGADETMNP